MEGNRTEHGGFPTFSDVSWGLLPANSAMADGRVRSCSHVGAVAQDAWKGQTLSAQVLTLSSETMHPGVVLGSERCVM